MSPAKWKRPSPSMIVATVALFVALGGGAYAGVAFNQVRSAQIKNGEVKTVDLANLSVSNAKLRNNSVNSAKIKNGTIVAGDLNGAVLANYFTKSESDGRYLARPTARAFHNANQSIPGTAAFTTVVLNSERFDPTGMHRTDVDTSRLTIASPGVYLVSANITWANNTTGARELNIRKNGTTIVARVVQPGDPTVNTTDQSASTAVQLAAGDFVEIVVRQNSGAPIAIVAAPEFSPELSATLLATL